MKSHNVLTYRLVDAPPGDAILMPAIHWVDARRRAFPQARRRGDMHAITISPLRHGL